MKETGLPTPPPLRFVDRPIAGTDRARRVLQCIVAYPDGRRAWIDVPHVPNGVQGEIAQ